MRTFKLLILFLLFLTIASYAYAARLDGRVFETTTERGIPALTVKLIPPKAAKRPEKITSTNYQGNFRFSGVPTGRYLIEVYQGVTILYRDIIEITRDMRKDIPLRKK
jgi:hypothetical protein